ncbi:hypothetical protein F0562_012855 [Nyssa sinensis]|uniref:Uncharacterized protein n=1 Tax=Nyssa sinensis TaxID=561372 RepID=A0A5J4ZXP0_9ASTE|nr:hypothetical protein F0562_012855 [Nyssa sinensis]
MAKHSDLKNSNFSLLNASDSQVSGTPDSLSLSQEPPDIRNWFSSYVYESPELNAGDDFEGCGSFRGRDCEKEGSDEEDNNKEDEENLGEFRRLGERDELVSDEKLASDGFVNGKNSEGDKKCAIKVLDSSDSLSLSSEPPDIKNWFLSYVYESPALDTSDFGVSDFKESEPGGGAFNADKSRKEKEKKLRTGRRDELVGGEKIALNGFVKCNGSVEDNQCGHQYVYKGSHGADRSKNSSVLRKISEQILEGKRTQNHDICPTKDVEKSSFNGDDFTEKLEGKFSQEVSHGSLDIHNNSGNNGGKSPRKSLHRRDSTEISSEAKGQTKDAGIQPPGKNGFISTRKSRSRVNDENSLKRSFESMKNRLTISPAGDKDANLRRKVLSERTNFQQTDALEIAGKWQCPQMSKPNLGPTLKQLRLEQWVHRL